jgi:alpha-ketoglutarate-dependent taurine dioxygenase
VVTIMTLSIRKLHPAVGAEVSGLDLASPLTAGTRTALLEAFAEHHVLVFPGADISDEEHVAFSRNFSDLETFPQGSMGAARLPEIYRVSNVGEDDEILPVESDTARYQSLTQVWHTDGSYLPVPSLGAVLHGIEVTDEGGETQFANMFLAHDALAEDRRRELEHLKARHSFQYSRALKGLPPMKPEELARVPPVDQPLIRVHPDGRHSLYLSAPLMECVVGWSDADSHALFTELVAHATQPAFVYRHRWRAHDVVMWDNRCTMHCVTPYDAATRRRVMHRTALVGTEPVTGVEA